MMSTGEQAWTDQGQSVLGDSLFMEQDFLGSTFLATIFYIIVRTFVSLISQHFDSEMWLFVSNRSSY